MPFLQQLEQRLATQKQQGLFRRRVCVKQNYDGVLSTNNAHFIDFASNDYLGLRHHPEVLQAWVEGLELYGSGSGASPLVTGYMQAHQQLEQRIATDLQRDAVLLFSSGFTANQALCRALFADGGNILCDKYMHASFIDGAIASKANFRRFQHNDLAHLLMQLGKCDSATPTLIASEGVFSMDGDTPDIAALVALAEQHQAWLMLDEAHSLGVIDNASGLGSVARYQLSQQQVPIVMGTFGKALACSGAFIAGSQTLIDYLVNFARDYVYSTAMPPAQAHAILCAWQLMQQPHIRAGLYNNIDYFKQHAAMCKWQLAPSNTAIQWIQVGSPHRVVQAANKLKELGIWVAAIRSPTVPKGTDRLRITLRANHTENDIQALIDVLNLVLGD